MKKAVLAIAAVSALALPIVLAARRDVGAAAWQAFEPGLELAVFEAPRRSEAGDSRIRVLRIDPGRFELRLLNATAPGEGQRRTARDWCVRGGLSAAINASMYQEDLLTSVSLMRTRGHTNNGHLTKDRSVLAFDPREAGLPPVALIDRECDPYDSLSKRYDTLVQSIRMVSCKRANVWSRQPKAWSAAAVGLDAAGRVLFIHVRSPYSTHDLIEMLLELPIDLARAMYVEGGPEAQLFVRGGGREEEFVGSFETGFLESDSNAHAWPVPNVIGVARKGTAP